MNSRVIPVIYTGPGQVYSTVMVDYFMEGLLRDEKKPRWSASVVDGFEKVEMMVAGLFTLGYLGVPAALIDTQCPNTHCAIQLSGEHLAGPLWAVSAPLSVRIGREGVATPQRVKACMQMIMTLPFANYQRFDAVTETLRRHESLPQAASPLRLT